MYDTLLVTVSLSDLKVDQSELATGGDAMYCNEVCSQNATRTRIQPATRIQILESDIRMQPVPELCMAGCDPSDVCLVLPNPKGVYQKGTGKLTGWSLDQKIMKIFVILAPGRFASTPY